MMELLQVQYVTWVTLPPKFWVPPLPPPPPPPKPPTPPPKLPPPSRRAPKGFVVVQRVFELFENFFARFVDFLLFFYE
jgi:hypothetical protein